MKNCLKGCIVLKFYYLLNKWKNRKLLATLVIFSFFLSKWNYGKLGDRYAIFLFFIFWTKWKKWKNGANKYDFFHFSIFLFLAKYGKIEKWVRNRTLFHFSHFLTIARKIKNSKISLLAVYSIFCIFEADFKISDKAIKRYFAIFYFLAIVRKWEKWYNARFLTHLSIFPFFAKNRKT